VIECFGDFMDKKEKLMKTIKRIPKTEIATEVKKLEDLLVRGEFSDILKQSKYLRESFKIHEKIKSLSKLDILKIRASTVMSEIYFYQGRFEDADDILQPLLEREEDILSMEGDILARDKLQIAEYYYAHHKIQRALEIGQLVLRQSKEKKDLQGMGESAHHIQRMYYHLEDFVHASYYYDRALEYFSTIALENPPKDYNVDWRIGKVLCRASFAYLRSCDLEKAKTGFNMAMLRLKKSNDILRIAHVQRGLGCIYRSSGEYDKSLDMLTSAMEKYDRIGHNENIARVLISLGQTYFNYSKVDEAKTFLNKALEISTRFPKQTIEAHLWLSWISQSTNVNVTGIHTKETVHHLNEAAKLNCRSPELISEMHISRGYCLLMEKKHEEAKKQFELSLTNLKDQCLPKVLANTYLSLAEWHGISKNIHAARRYLQQAKELLARDSMRVFLNKKMVRIRECIENNSTEYFIVEPNDIGDWKSMVRKLEKWVINTTEGTIEKINGKKVTKADIAKKLKITEQGLYQMKKRSLKQQLS